jgi:2-deoxy-D-gluconate 3-dehydrogenase
VTPELVGARVLVVGGTSGIGHAAARALAARGSDVCITGRDAEKAARVQAAMADRSTGHPAPSVPFLTFDIADAAGRAAAIAALAANWGRIDCLIYCAGIAHRALPQDTLDTDWDGLIDINLSGAFKFIRDCHGLLRGHDEPARVVLIGSTTTRLGVAFGPAYTASKAGLTALTRSLAAAWASDRIRVNAVVPGWVETPMTATSRRSHPDFYRRVDERIPMGSWGTPDDIAGPIVFLCSGSSSYMTGVVMPVDGGLSAVI